MEFKEIVEKCIELRRAFERDEARFFLGLVEVEQKYMSILKLNGCATFDNFIRSYELCKPERYHRFKAGLGMITNNEAKQIGAKATSELVKVVEKKNVPAYVEAVSLWSAKRHGLVPSKEAAARLLRQVDPRPEVPKPVREQNALEQLRLENQALKRRVKELEAENAKLRTALAEKKKAKPSIDHRNAAE